MYCEQCGMKLIANAKFCHQCGKRIEMLDEDIGSESIHEDKEGILSESELLKEEDAITIIKTPQRVVGPEIILEILGQQLPLSEEIAGLKVVRDYFNDYAEKNVAKFKDYIESNVKNFDDIYDKAIPFSVNCINAAVENAVDIARNLGIFDMNYEWLSMLMEENWDSDGFFEYYSQIARVLENMAAKLTSYRKIERANVPQWQGGGFGILGAIKGHVQATALNIGTNVIREIGNAVVDSKDKEKLRKAKEYLYKDSRMIENLIMITYSCSFMPYYVLLPIFEEAGIVIADAEKGNGVSGRVQEIFENSLSKTGELNGSLNSLFEIIQKYPFNSALYVYLEWMCSNANEDIIKIIEMLGLKHLYSYEKITLERSLFESVKDAKEDNVKAVQDKLKLLNIVEQSKIASMEEIKIAKKELRRTWANIIQLLPEYDEIEMQNKIEAYQELKQEYGKEEKLFKPYQDDINRLELKYENKVKLPILEKDVNQIKEKQEKIAKLVIDKNFSELWNEAEKQNGYAQTLLYRFYLAKIGNMKDKINSIEQIDTRCLFLMKKRMEGNIFAKFIYDLMVCKINEIYNSFSDKENERKIHIDYLFVISEAARAGIVYAKYCVVGEINKYDYENYESYRRRNTELYEFKPKEVRIFSKETANALIPNAVDRLSDFYKGKRKNYLCSMECNYKSADKLQEFYKVLNIVDVLGIMEQNYELQTSEVGELVSNKILCSQCGNLIKKGKNFCSRCGKAIR